MLTKAGIEYRDMRKKWVIGVRVTPFIRSLEQDGRAEANVNDSAYWRTQNEIK